jgi:hypothetical protein
LRLRGRVRIPARALIRVLDQPPRVPRVGTTPRCEVGRRLAWDDEFRGTTNATEVRRLVDDEHIYIGPASASDVREGYPWRWVVFYGGERRSGACATREAAKREAETVLKLLMERASG